MSNIDQAARYREIKRLGAGGMATVTLAEDTVLRRLVALKRVYGAGDPRGMLRLQREALVGASLNHPNLVFVYDAQVQDDGDAVIIMEYVEGETLADVIASRGRVTPTEALRVLRGVAAALDAIHERGIVHRDVKPANVLLGRDGAVKLADLGVADVADRTRITSAGAVVGSFSYMAPEQLDGAAPGPAMDIYALAAVAYEMLAGEKARPQANPLALAHAIATEPPPDLRDVLPGAPVAASEVLRRGMSADPVGRPRSARELVRRLESAFEPGPTTERVRSGLGAAALPARGAPPPPPRAAPPPPAHGEGRRKSILAPALLALAGLAVLIVVVAALGSGNGNRSPAGSGTSSASSETSSASSGTSSTRSAKSPGHTTAQPTSARSQPSTTTTPGTTTPAATNPTSAPPGVGGSGSGTPVAAVQQFYAAAARHDYAAAWDLAGPNLRSQLGGYGAFQGLMSSVRSITFHSAQLLPGSSSSAATVALRTTSVLTNRTEDCAGTARTVRSGGAWLVDHVAIDCALRHQ